MKTLTDKMIYQSIIDNTIADIDKEYLINWAQNKINQIDRKATRAKVTNSSISIESDPLMEAILEATSDEYFEPIAEIASRIQGEDVTFNKVAYRLNAATKINPPLMAKEKILYSSPGEKGFHWVVGYKRIN